MEFVKRGALRTQATKLCNRSFEYLKSTESQISEDNIENFSLIEEELVSLLDRLNVISEKLSEANEEVKPFVKEDAYQAEFETMIEYEDKCTDAISRIKQRMHCCQSYAKNASGKAINDVESNNDCLSVASNHSNERKSETMQNVRSNAHHKRIVKIPRLELKRFNGEYKDWIPFWEQFRTLIHENDELTGTEKFNYLQSVLTGRAAASIGGFIPAASNCYEDAIALLRDEYGDQEKLIDHNIQHLMAMKVVVSRYDIAGLRMLYNSVISSTRTLTALGVDSSQYFIMLKSVLLKCLPKELQTDFYRTQGKQNKLLNAEKDGSVEEDNRSVCSDLSRCFDGDKTVKEILKYVKLEIESLEKAKELKPTASGNLDLSRRSSCSQLTRTAAALTAQSAREIKECHFCGNNNHHMTECRSDTVSLSERKDKLKKDGRCYRCGKVGHNSRICRNQTVRCAKCKGRHMTSICDPQFIAKVNLNADSKHTRTVSGHEHIKPSVNLCSAGNVKADTVYLQTACVLASNLVGGRPQQLIRLILDGGSQRSYIREAVVKDLNLKEVDTVRMGLAAFGDKTKGPMKRFKRVRVILKSIHDNRAITILALVVPEICPNLLPPPYKVDTFDLPLADSNECGKPVEGINMLIGADHYWKIVEGEIKHVKDDLVMIKTVFGWTVQGPAEDLAQDKYGLVSLIMFSALNDETNENEYTHIWDLETIGITDDTANNELPINGENHVKREGDRFVASLLWNGDKNALKDNKNVAFKRLNGLIRRLSRNISNLLEYDRLMQNFIEQGLAERVADKTDESSVYYMPHKPVYRDDKDTTRVRIVYDASSKAESELSLNDHLHAGPNMLPNLISILLNFRLGEIGLVADIEKAYLQVMLDENDRDTHRFFWFGNKISSIETLPPLQVFRMTRVTFGVKCSPYHLNITIRQLLKEQSKQYPETCKVLEDSFYVDDLAISVSDELSAESIYSNAKIIMRKASMNIRKWNSNYSHIRTRFQRDGERCPDIQKVLGVLWFCTTDEIAVDLTGAVEFAATSNGIGTKRNVLQLLARIYDPLGMLGPFTLNFKILFQNLWKLKSEWDEQLPSEMDGIWRKHTNELPLLHEFAIPRWIKYVKKSTRLQLHVFADASLAAYGAVAYARICANDNKVHVMILCSRNRLVPIKENNVGALTLPKLELTAALVAARLAKFLKNNLRVECESTTCWSDSKIALHWITGDVKKWNMYVAHRVKEIKKLTDTTEWRHVSGASNPADLLTRGISANCLLHSQLWLEGPDWLIRPSNEWPIGETHSKEVDEVSLISLLNTESITSDAKPVEPMIDIRKYSSYLRLIRITAYVLRASKIWLKKPTTFGKYLTIEELEQANLYWIKLTQLTEYNKEIGCLNRNELLPTSSKILTLRPKLDVDGILRVGTRLEYLDADQNVCYPMLIPINTYLAKLIITDAHCRAMHAGVNTTIVYIRQKYWIPRIRQLVKKIINRCGVCKRLFGKNATQTTAPLPRQRLFEFKPFDTVGIDFAGPLFIKDSNGSRKVYILLITCATVRAVHLELVPDMTTESCLLALRRFISRRGAPRRIISDNAKTFKKGAIEIRDFGLNFTSERVQDFASENGISWQFIVERAPWWGGFWERLVRSVKNILKAVIGRGVLNFDQLHTLLAEAESVINSRPLTYVSDDPTDLSPLTPAHFLVGYAPVATVDCCKGSCKAIQLKWKSRLQQLGWFWKRWRTEYIQLLRSVHYNRETRQTTEIQIGEVVLVQDQSNPRVLWKLAVVEKLFPGRDGKIRACEVRLPNGSRMRRPIQMLYPLEIRSILHAGPEDVENI